MPSPTFGWPLPDPEEGPDVPADLEALADAIDQDLAGIQGGFEDRLNELEGFGVNGEEARTIDEFSGGAGTNVTTLFDDIDQSYSNLLVIWRGGNNSSNVLHTLSMRFNGSGADDYRGFVGFAHTEAWTVNPNNTSGTSGWAGVVGTNSNSFGTIWIPNYSTAGQSKGAKGDCVARGISGSTVNQAFGFGLTIWTTDAITSIQLWPASALWNSGGVQAQLIGFR